MLAIHIGPGQLGLGLILPCLRRAGIDVCLVGRPDSPRPERSHYLLDSTDPNVGLEQRSVAYACNAACVADFPGAVQERLASDEPLLITCALGRRCAASCEQLVEELIERRPAGAETALIVCENDLMPVYERLERRYGERVTVCWSVVDRVCTWLDGGMRLGGRRAVRAHPVGEWVIGHPDPSCELMRALAYAQEVTVVAPEQVGGYKRRKLWTVNGLHIVLGLLARRSHVDAARTRRDLLPLVAQQEEFQVIATRVVASIDAGLQRLHPELPFDDDYGPARVQVFCETPDFIERLLRSLVRSDLQEFMRRFDERICDAARAAHEAGSGITVFRSIVALVLLVLRDLRSYYPPEGCTEDVPPDADTDALVVRAFERALRDWLPASERELRVAELALALEQQRDILG